MKVAVNGVELFFDVEGVKLVAEGPWMRERPTVLLLHTGPGLDHSLYKEHLGPALAQDAQVLYLDQRGAGRSDWSSREHWTVETWVEDLVQLREALELERLLLVGTGLGGVIAVSYAAHAPEAVERLVLVSTVARYVHTREIAVFDRLGGPEAGEVAVRYWAEPNEATFAEYLRVCLPLFTREPLPAETVARIAMNTELTADWDRRAQRDFDLRPDAARVRCPTLLLIGEDDPASSLAGGQELADALPQELVTYRTFANVGHGVFRDRPEAIELVREFLFPSPPEPA